MVVKLERSRVTARIPTPDENEDPFTLPMSQSQSVSAGGPSRIKAEPRRPKSISPQKPGLVHQQPKRSHLQVLASSSQITPNGDALNDSQDDLPGKRRKTNGMARVDSAVLSPARDEDDVVQEVEESLLAEEEPQSSAADQVGEVQRGQRSADGFLPGSIRRISLHNFLTYDAVDFRVGPYLNMICGPNGTGKSSIACAIALGLGGSPAVLGRAKTVSSFVKAGKTDAWIEIELQNWPNKSNRVIKRSISTSNNQSDWFIDGRSSTQSKVVELVSDYNIDVANLCSFLPQDKVAEFARMTDAKRLVETQKAAGGAKLVRWHDALIEYGKTATQLEAKLKEYRQNVSHLEQRNQALEVDVQRFEEREQIEQRIEKLHVMVAMAKYNMAKKELDQLKARREQARRELRESAERGQPLRQKRTDLEDKTGKVKLELQRLDSTHKSDEGKRKKLVERIKELGKEIDDKHAAISALNKREQNRKTRMQHLRTEIQDRKAQMGDKPIAQDTSTLNKELTEIRNRERQLQLQKSDLAQQKNEISLQSQTIEKSTHSLRTRLASLDNVREQRFEALRQSDDQVHKATLWIRDHQHLFRRPVYDPIVLEIQVKNTQYASAVESCIPWNVLKTIVCQTRADYDLLTRELLDKLRLRVTIAEVEGIMMNSMMPNVPREELGSFGFDGYAIDFVDGPVDVLVHLCKQSNLHRIAISLNTQVDMERIEQSGHFQRFVIGMENFTINTSRYGSDLRQTLSREINPARNLVRSVDRATQSRIGDQIKELYAKRQELESQTGQLMKQEQDVLKKVEQLQDQAKELKAERDDMARAQKQWDANRVMIEVKTKELAGLEKEPLMEERRAREMKAVRALTATRCEKMQDLQALVVGISQLCDRKHQAQLHKWQWDATSAMLENMIKELEESETALMEACEAANRQAKAARRDADILRESVQEKIDRAGDLVADLDPDDEEVLNLDRCTGELRAEMSKLELAEGVQPEVIRQYTRRKEEIAAVTRTITDLAKAQTDVQAKMSSVRGKWEPKLRRVVAEVSKRFSKAFDDLGLAGELRIGEDADFEKWKLEIMVKFRNNEELAPLSGHHQSGGEKALSTIMYVMSLLQLSRSPFTLVDEINQGMDSKAERAAHNHIVNITCQSDSSQYFLITPKLLPDLRCHERQKVLLVNNGEWLEDRFTFDSVLRQRKRAMGLDPTLRAISLPH
nr:structural maintenance of chromosome protein [Farysia itapuensis]